MLNRHTLAWTTLGLMILAFFLAEQDRPWKRLQAENRARELARLRSELEAELRSTAEARRRLDAEVAAASETYELRRKGGERLDDELARARSAQRWAAAAYERLRTGSSAGPVSEQRLRNARLELEKRQRRVDDLTSELGHLRAELDSAESRRGTELKRIRRLEDQIAELEKGAFFRRWPLLRGLDPTLSVIELAPPGLFRDTPVGRVGRLDRCATCHPSADHPGSLVGESTPHPPELVGCTVCHGGNGRATDFTLAGHRFQDAEQEAERVEAWGFSRSRLPRDLILPTAFLEAGCAECHTDSPATGAETVSLDLGRRRLDRLGCAGCHEAQPANEPRPKPGPPLDRIAAKTTPEWTFHWIAAPRRVRPTTSMPHFFGDGPSREDEEVRRETAVIASMVHYLFSQAPNWEDDPPPEGEPADGARLFHSVGCTGCHLLDAEARRDEVDFERLHGPSLAGVGDKLRPAWLYAWLRDPRSHRPETPMPNLRLTGQEAADLTAFLASSRGEVGRELEIPPVDASVRDERVLHHLEQEYSLEESAARLERMDVEERMRYLGRRSLETFGCHGCHGIPGLEDAPPIAAPLAEIGRDPRSLFEEDDVPDRFHPDQYLDYGLSRRETESLRVALLALKPSSADPGRRARAQDEVRILEAGRQLVEDYGCPGCHQLDERGGALVKVAAGPSQPPALSSAGARFQPSWLFDYLDEPGRTVRRPWLKVRMPSFHLSAREKNLLVHYLALRERQPLFLEPPPSPSARDLEVGRAVVSMLRCRSCHADSPESSELAPGELAPAYRGLSDRLRPDWVVEWILDPESLVPETVMPAAFAKNERGEPDSSFLTATISAPMFLAQRQRLLPLFESEDELMAYLEDAQRVSVAIRDYLWTLEE